MAKLILQRRQRLDGECGGGAIRRAIEL